MHLKASNIEKEKENREQGQKNMFILERFSAKGTEKKCSCSE
jgi:hypothetical protein